MSDFVLDFYDRLAPEYHLMFADWRAEVLRQSELLAALLAAEAPGATQVLDCACGIGTQAIGLARAGYELTATDLSAGAVQRAREEAQHFGVRMRFATADFRRLEDARAAAADPGLPGPVQGHETGLPRGTMPRVFDGPDGRRIAFQVWDWSPDARSYAVHQYFVHGTGDTPRVSHYASRFRALRRDELGAALLDAGLAGVRWRMPGQSGFYQPLVLARAP
jgi:SAM-dependent methyltransferase